MNAQRTVSVRTNAAVYDVAIGNGLLAGLGAAVRRVAPGGSGRTMVVVDSGVPGAMRDQALASLTDAGFTPTHISVAPSEDEKTFDTLERILQACAAARIERSDPVIAIGGGIVGDIAGFAAATYRRGVPVVQCPSTLLAMVDASVGGKTGVNLAIGEPGGGERLLKNAVGAFHQPRLVVADISLLASLDARTFACGVAECVKHAMIGEHAADPDLWAWLTENAPAIVSRDDSTLCELIFRNVRAKAHIVAGDERETAPDGGRMLLNLGHTFAHVIETSPGVSVGAPGDQNIHHGEAVALGLLCACRCASELGLCDANMFDDVRALLTTFDLPTRASGIPPASNVIDTMRHDKKAGAGQLRLVLPVGPGRCRVVENADERAIQRALDAIRSEGT